MRTLLTLSLTLLVFVATSCSDPITSPESTAASESLLTLEGAGGADARMPVLNFTAPLSGDQEVPPVDTDATGLAQFQYKNDVLTYKLIVANIDDVRMSHIHLAPAGSNGGVVVWLYPDGPPPQLIPGTTQGILAEGTITADDLVGELAGQTLEDLLAEMAAGNAYVNVHTVAHGGGEIRGQISHGNGMRR